uniref:NADH-ubiquinone oxidoreductase chain 1 n=1 Tax=Harpiocephalus harpia TaxID=124749 RepID=A0A890JC97_HARHA|nr:NADH dehydrogenase subunit 1 [Harpiocephalus harpia]
MYFINLLAMIIPILLAVAFLTLLERKMLGYMQLRKGPNIVGPYGLLQPIADAVKLFTKEPSQPSTASPILFIIAPTMALTLALTMWVPLPHTSTTLMKSKHVVYISLIKPSRLYYYMIGWASNSKYALIGALRAVAQTISYEVTLAIIILSILLMNGSFTLHTMTTTQEYIWLLIPSWPLAMMWFISTLAETNRAPFDLTEGESELVSGFNVEYAGGPFALFFLAEYANIIMMNAITVILFLGTYQNMMMPELYTINFTIKTLLFTTFFLWIRASYPRFRYDQLMHLLWKNFLPLTLVMCMWHVTLPIILASIPPQT